MSIRSELEEIQGDDELLMPEKAEDWAQRHPSSDLHRQLEWDNEVAGHEYRLWQIRRLIAIHIVHEEGYREMVSLSIDRTSNGGYRRMSDVLPRVDLREAMLADALRDLERLQKKYEKLTELAEVWAARERVVAGRRRGRRSAVPREEVATEARP